MKKLINFVQENSFEICGLIMAVAIVGYGVTMLVLMHKTIYA